MQWTETVNRPYFACGRDRATLHSVWRQALRAERAVGANSHYAAFLGDGEKFYERFPLQRLVHQGVATQFPLTVLRLALATYSGPRCFTLAGLIVRPWYARCGIPAGCGLADAMVKLHCVVPLDAVVQACPSCTLDVYVGDFVGATYSNC